MAEGQAGETGEIRPLGLAGGRWPWLAWEYVRADVRGRSATVRECAHGRGVSTLATVTSADFETITGFCVPVSVFRVAIPGFHRTPHTEWVPGEFLPSGFTRFYRSCGFSK